MNSLNALTLSLILLIPQIVLIRPSLATTIAVLKTQSEIVAGADSMGCSLPVKSASTIVFGKYTRFTISLSRVPVFTIREPVRD